MGALLALLLASAASAGPASREAPPTTPLVRVAGLEEPALPWDGDGGWAADVARLEGSLVAELERRGVTLGPGARARLRRHLEDAANAAPLRFHYFATLAPRAGEAYHTELFRRLREEPEAFGAFVASQVSFIPRPPAPSAPAGEERVLPLLRPSAADLDAMAAQYERYLRRRVTYELRVECCVPADDYGLIFDGGRRR